jgi:hypothetical protein
VLALAYYWQGNLFHELVGTGMFLLVVVHNAFNRRWYGTIAKRQGLVNIAITLLLLAAMLVLLITSGLISESLFRFLGLDGGFTARQIHSLAGYLVLIIVSLHLGLRWPMIMGIGRSLFGITGKSAVRSFPLRVIACVIAIQGVRSSFALEVGTKLSLQLTLDWWNFEESSLEFFLHCIAIAGMYVSLSYYAMQWVRYRKVSRAASL